MDTRIAQMWIQLAYVTNAFAVILAAEGEVTEAGATVAKASMYYMQAFVLIGGD